MPPDLSVSIISADNLSLLLPCLRSISDSTHRIGLEVFVVDNASTDGTAAAVQAEFPQVHVLRNEIRLGFSTNNNQVLGQGQGRYLMLLNDDTLVLDGALDRLVAFMDTHPQAGAVGGYLLNPDGTVQRGFARFPHPVVEAILPAGTWSYRLGQRRGQPLEVDSVCGAAMLVRRQIVEQVGVLDVAFDPIYSEEVDWCYRIKRAGWKIYALPQARIVHYGSQTMDRAVPQKYELLLSKKALFFRKHAGARTSGVYRLTLMFSTLVKLLWWTVVGLLPTNRRHSKERKELHWYLLKRIPSL